jgi:septum site-determining protein MinC
MFFIQPQAVVLKGRHDGITVELDDRLDFSDLKEMFRHKVKDAKQFFAGARADIMFKGRALTEAETRALVDIVREETTLDVYVIHEAPEPEPEPEPEEEEEEEPEPVAPRDEPLDHIPLSADDAHSSVAEASGPAESASVRLPHDKHVTTFHQGSLRSGQSIRCRGSVVIIGDINPGSQIIAEGHIIVLGLLKGMAHAGCTGNELCFVSALGLMPTQLRIASHIATIPANMQTKRPAYAYIQNNQVYIAPLT